MKLNGKEHVVVYYAIALNLKRKRSILMGFDSDKERLKENVKQRLQRDSNRVPWEVLPINTSRPEHEFIWDLRNFILGEGITQEEANEIMVNIVEQILELAFVE